MSVASWKLRAIEGPLVNGLTVADAVGLMGVSPAAVKRVWTGASARLKRVMAQETASGS